MFDWNDVKALLAVARGGSTAAAARELGVNQTTVARRLEALERDLDTRLVERHQAGANLTEAGLSLVADAEAMERAALAMRQKLEAHRRGVAGTVRVTLSEMLAITVVTPMLPEFRELYPDLVLELMVTDDMLDLEAGEADVAFRGAQALPNSNLVARKVSTVDWALYCSRDYANRMGLPATPADLQGHVIIGGADEPQTIPGLAAVLRETQGVEPTLKSSSVTNMWASVRAGLGIGPMVCLMADTEPDLVQVFPPQPESVAHTWIVTRPELKDSPRVRAFIDFFAPRFQAIAREYEERGRATREARLKAP
ncbi:LysR family transcriptional regulator [Phenylobacterium sp.]|uniref:LysR family transcriptional regulator n=1 Tax=Phenylobacterium sp. TaxID=1871053 RepID=UPI0025E83CA8|nr:LysR family transcriptional regulator [Phenylobacterium sp.]